MPRVRILIDYGAIEGFRPGDVVDITNPYKLIEEGKVELVTEEEQVTPDPVQAEEVPVSEQPVETTQEQTSEGVTE